MTKINPFFKLIYWTLILSIFFKVGQLLIRIYNIFLIQKLINGHEAYRAEAIFIENEFKTEGVIAYAITIALFVFLSIWLYVSYKYAHLIAGKPLRFKPLLALFSFVIPFFNLFGPYKIMQEIWMVQNRIESKEREGRSLIKQWWFLSLVLFAYSRYCNSLFTQSQNLHDYLKAEYHSLILLTVCLHYLITTIKLITLIHQPPSIPEPAIAV